MDDETGVQAAKDFEAWFSRYKVQIAPRPIGWWETGDLEAAYLAGGRAMVRQFATQLAHLLKDGT